jgi:arylformamidase
MRVEDYPPQEPISDFARPYHEETLRRAEGLDGIDTQYGDNAYQSVVVFPASEPTGEVFAFIHGGGWTNGYKEWMSFMAPVFNERGITFASIGYRLAPDFTFPTGFEDCADGVAWVYNNIAEYGGNPGRLFVGGHSAGGHHTGMLGVGRNWQTQRGLPLDAVKGYLPISGVFHFGENSGMTMRPRFLGPEKVGNEDAASPLLHIPDNPPPFFLAWGSKDFSHLIDHSKGMAAALKDAGGDVDTFVIEGRDHLGASLAAGESDQPWVDRATDWMRSH